MTETRGWETRHQDLQSSDLQVVERNIQLFQSRLLHCFCELKPLVSEPHLCEITSRHLQLSHVDTVVDESCDAGQTVIIQHVP